MQISVVIPCYRSRETICPLVERLVAYLRANYGGSEVILVVDGSPDDTYALAHDLSQRFPEVRAVLLRRNYGQHNALVAGIARAHHSVIVTMDDDLQHRPESLGLLLAPLEDPLVDLVYGVPEEEEHGFLRSFASNIVKRGLSLAGVAHSRSISAFRAFRTDLRDGFAHSADMFGNIDVMLSWTTTGVREVKVPMDAREHGTSGYSFAALVRHAMNMVTGYGTLPLRIITRLGVLSFLVGFGLLLVVLWKFLTGQTTVVGWTSMASMIAVFGGVQMLSVGVLGEYLGRLHFRSMRRPSFFVRVDDEGDGPRVGIPGLPLPPALDHETPAEVAAAVTLRGHRQGLPSLALSSGGISDEK